MDKFIERGQAQGAELFLEKILHRLHIVIGDPLDFFDPLGIVQAEGQIDVSQGGQQSFVNLFQLGQGHLTQGDKILDFHSNPVFDQCAFRKIGRQDLSRATIASIHRRNGFQRRQRHFDSLFVCFIAAANRFL